MDAHVGGRPFLVQRLRDELLPGLVASAVADESNIEESVLPCLVASAVADEGSSLSLRR